MRTYETVFVVNPQSDDATIDRQVTSVVDIIKNNDGKIHRENRLGTRRLAYEVNGLAQGFFASIIYDGPTSVLPILDRHFRLEEAYIRYLTIKFEGDPSEAVEEKPDFERPGRPERKGKEKSEDKAPAAEAPKPPTPVEEPKEAAKPIEPEPPAESAAPKPEAPKVEEKTPETPPEEDEL